MLKHTKRYVGFSENGSSLNSYTSSGGTFDTLSAAKQRSSAVKSGELKVIEYELVPTGVYHVKQNGKWIEKHEETN